MGQVRIQEAAPALKSSSRREQKKQSPSQPEKKPRLSMKFLQDLIRELQHENLMLTMRVECLEEQLSEVLDDATLAKRIERLEKQIDEWSQVHKATAAALEQPDTAETAETAQTTDTAAEAAMPAGLPPAPAPEASQQTLPAAMPAGLSPAPAPETPQQTLPAVVAPQPIRTPRSERHQTPKKKKPFWASWFRLHTSS